MYASEKTEPHGTALPAALEQPPSHRSALEATLTAIFERVLARPSVGRDDDFFDLGGDSILAINLMLEIEQATGQDLPITTVYDFASVSAIAELLCRGATPRNSSLVLLKPGAPQTPLFIAHGLGGSVMELRAFAKRIDTPHAIYGIQARGADGAQPPVDRVEDMARFDIDDVRQVQAHGPYLLAGFSFGGLVALEMAHILSGAGETVALLVLLDTYPHTKYWPMRCRWAAWTRLVRSYGSPALWTRLSRYHASVLRRMPIRATVPYILRRAGRAVPILFDIFRLGTWLERFADFPGPAPRQETELVLSAALRRVQRAGEVAFARYRPCRYDGEITFVKAESAGRVPFDARLLWQRLAREVTVVTVPSGHQDLVRAGAEALAEQLSAILPEYRRTDRTAIPE